ncbi:hypothetical protein BABINDRAFT_170666 [Babjeviella inositovora NRRL Y-12698]|uniref:Translation initiation factor IF-2, mitochondrial n=1 Tax=Babjeviella inositovora NRRL Y-12698 TaxID=984486 RepID=A0A1E3QYF7_9ASCO|nr:uncharacterized protein BABINDRAFT_170666 [Babjeviella inositovora NRRL Y-12698]ODQ82152.1 hypothetical protein BABINDRAFT_170666 [Babjeviella inositovora NRRL Y-12698]
MFSRLQSSQKVSRKRAKISIPRFCTVSNLATIINAKVPALLRNLESLGFEGLTHDYILDQENATLIADDYGFEVVLNDETGIDIFPEPINELLLQTRAPIVTIMGHVDHGKTTILDYLRNSSIVDQEHGGITQHIGAFSVTTPVSKKSITFLDTPGHAAFLKMRERGANVTDIVVLVVAGDDSVKPQTIEAIKHAKKAGVQMIVAINKCDKPGANPDKVVADLSRHEVDVEDYGGDVQVIRVSGKTGLNMDKLEEAIVTLSEIMDVKAEVEKVPAEGWVIESHLKKGLGSVATVLVTRGTVKPGSILVAGQTYCRVKSMKDEHGKVVRAACPSKPVEVWGWRDLPEAGDSVIQAKDEKLAKKVVDNRANRAKTIDEAKDVDAINKMRKKQRDEVDRLKKVEELKKYGLEGTAMNAAAAEDTCKQISFIIKADVSGSAEAVKESIAHLGNDEVKVRVLYDAVGPATETDLERAKTSGSSILAFNIDTPKDIERKAFTAGVDIKSHNIIYHLIEEVTEILTSNLAPEVQTRFLGEAEIKAIFEVTGKKKQKTFIAGCKIANGSIKRNQAVKIFRGEKEVYSGLLSSLKQGKNEETEIKKGSECGMAFEAFEGFKEGDVVKPFELVEVKRFL